VTEAAELPSRARSTPAASTSGPMCFHLIPDLKLVHEGGVVFGKG
jgi:hypothetical protein